jgi:hypothetical protein
MFCFTTKNYNWDTQLIILDYLFFYDYRPHLHCCEFRPIRVMLMICIWIGLLRSLGDSVEESLKTDPCSKVEYAILAFYSESHLNTYAVRIDANVCVSVVWHFHLRYFVARAINFLRRTLAMNSGRTQHNWLLLCREKRFYCSLKHWHSANFSGLLLYYNISFD